MADSTLNIDLSGMAEAIRKLDDISKLNRVKGEMRAQAIRIRNLMAKSPKKVYSPNPLIAANDRVRRGFFARLRSGEITVPYQRTGKSRQSWSIEARNNGFTYAIGTNIGHAQLLWGEKQTRAHALTGWPKASDVIKRETQNVKRAIEGAIEKELQA